VISLTTLFVLVLVRGLWCRLAQARQRVVLSGKAVWRQTSMAGDALLQVGAAVTEWTRTDDTAIIAATTRALLVAAGWLAAT